MLDMLKVGMLEPDILNLGSLVVGTLMEEPQDTLDLDTQHFMESFEGNFHKDYNNLVIRLDSLGQDFGMLESQLLWSPLCQFAFLLQEEAILFYKLLSSQLILNFLNSSFCSNNSKYNQLRNKSR